LFRAREILRKRPRLAKHAKSRNIFLRHLTSIFSLISQLQRKFLSGVVVVKNNLPQLTTEIENNTTDKLPELDASLMLSSFQNALVYSEKTNDTVQPQSMRNDRKFQMTIVSTLRLLCTHFSHLIRVIIRQNQLMCVNINEMLHKDDIVVSLVDLINSYENRTENKYGMQKLSSPPVTMEIDNLVDEFVADINVPVEISDTTPANNFDNIASNTDTETTVAQNNGSTEVRIKSQQPMVQKCQEIPSTVECFHYHYESNRTEYVEGEPDRVWPLVDLTTDTPTVENNETIPLEFPVENNALNNQAVKDCDANDNDLIEIIWESNIEKKEQIDIDDNSWKDVTVQSNTGECPSTTNIFWQKALESCSVNSSSAIITTQTPQPSTVQSNTNKCSTTKRNLWQEAVELSNQRQTQTERPRWNNLGQNRTRKILLQEKESVVSGSINESPFFGSERAISKRTTTFTCLTTVQQKKVSSTSTSNEQTLRVRKDIFIERDSRKRQMSNNVSIETWNHEDDDDYNNTHF
jgi:hypothetical protein